VAYATDYAKARELADRYDIPLITVDRDRGANTSPITQRPHSSPIVRWRRGWRSTRCPDRPSLMACPAKSIRQWRLD